MTKLQSRSLAACWRQPLGVLLAGSLLLANLAAATPGSPAPSPAPAAPAAVRLSTNFAVLGAAQLRGVTFARRTDGPLAMAAARLDPSAGRASDPSGDSSDHRIGKAALIWGVLGTLGVVGGVVLLQQSKTNSACLTGSASATTACSDVHQAAKIVIPASAVIAGLGYFFAFHHRF